MSFLLYWLAMPLLPWALQNLLVALMLPTFVPQHCTVEQGSIILSSDGCSWFARRVHTPCCLSLVELRSKDGDHYIVNGSKIFITSGMRADFYTVAVRTGEQGDGAGGISLLLIERDTPGFSRTQLDKQGWWCSDTAALHFDDCRVPASNLIGQENKGFLGIMLNFNNEVRCPTCFETSHLVLSCNLALLTSLTPLAHTPSHCSLFTSLCLTLSLALPLVCLLATLQRIAIAVQAIGLARACLEEAVAWSRERHTFGEPLIARQVIQHKLVDMYTRIEATAAFTESVTAQAAAGKADVARVSVVKNVATDMLAFVSSEAVQILGACVCVCVVSSEYCFAVHDNHETLVACFQQVAVATCVAPRASECIER